MGLVHFLDPVDYISGKISKKFRTIYNHRKLSDRRYTQVRGDRTTAVTAEEIQSRNHFAAIARAVNARRKDLTKIVTDIQNFKAQRDNPNGYKTLRQYLWHICAQEING